MRPAVALLLWLCIAPVGGEPVAVFAPDASMGVGLVPAEDGRWEKVSRGGREAVAVKQDSAPPSHYLYFQLDAEVRERLSGEAWLLVDFRDEGAGFVRAQYNTADNPYREGPGLLVTGSSSWQRGLLHLTGFVPQGRQNAGGDFRLYFAGALTVSRLEVHASKPDVIIPSDRERLEKSMRKTPPPEGMFYTFGNDCDETTGLLYRSLGVTSIESYVTWETCERKGEGQWDWSQWDAQVDALRKSGLKWVPFLILGPAYSTPDWFRQGPDHYGCRCLEHGIQSKVESLWNPDLPKWIDRFLGEFAKRYRDSGVIESVLLGIQGDFGEAIYSVTGGGWTFNVPGEYHNHPGFWCDDPHALASFRKFAAGRYRSIAALNRAWGTSWKSVDEADFPGRKDDLAAFRKSIGNDAQARRRWLDFVQWYRACMTEWSDWWMAATRKHFPKTPIYLCTGGDAPPEHGSNFAEQCRVAAKHGAGVRITNEGSNYGANFALTRWVASAGKHYGAYFGFEPAGAEDETGIAARIYNATASGANQLHDYNPNVVGSQSRIEAQQRYIRHLFHVTSPMVPAAVWYPNTSMTLTWGGYLEKVAKLRDYLDFDLVDETMLASGALKSHRVLIVIHGNVMETADARRIAEWVRGGGRLIVMDVPQFESVEAAAGPERVLFGNERDGRRLGAGRVARVGGWEALADALISVFADLKQPMPDLKADSIYTTQIAPSRFLTLDMASAPPRIGEARLRKD